MEFRVDRSSGVAPYRQLVQQVTEALRLGWLHPGAQLPVVRQVVASSGVNANTVLKAYRELELRGLVEVRQGSGTFVTEHTDAIDVALLDVLRGELETWAERAAAAGLTSFMVIRRCQHRKNMTIRHIKIVQASVKICCRKASEKETRKRKVHRN